MQDYDTIFFLSLNYEDCISRNTERTMKCYDFGRGSSVIIHIRLEAKQKPNKTIIALIVFYQNISIAMLLHL